MNIVFCRYRNVCEPDYIDAFAALGINVVELNLSEVGGEELSERAAALGEIFRKNTPMFVFSINFFPYVSLTCKSLGIIYVSVSVTCPMMEIFNTTIRNACNRVFLFDRAQYEAVCDENPQGIFYLPLGAGVDRIDALLGNEASYKYDVSFVGSLYNEKDPFVGLTISEDKKKAYEELMIRQIEATATGQDLLEGEIGPEDVALIKENAERFYPSDLSVFNIDEYVAVNNYLSPHMTYLERVRLLNGISKNCSGKIDLFTQSDTAELSGVVVHGGVSTLDEMPYVFRQSRINLNITTRSIKTGIAQRVWDVLACKGFLISNYQDEIPDFLEIGRHLVCYESEAELYELIDYYLDHEDQRREIAEAGYLQVKAQGKVLDRVMAIVRAIAG